MGAAKKKSPGTVPGFTQILPKNKETPGTFMFGYPTFGKDSPKDHKKFPIKNIYVSREVVPEDAESVEIIVRFLRKGDKPVTEG